MKEKRLPNAKPALVNYSSNKYNKITKQHYQRLELGTSSGSVKIWSELSAKTGKPINELLEQAKEAGDVRVETDRVQK